MILDIYSHGVRDTLFEAFHDFKQTMRISGVLYRLHYSLYEGLYDSSDFSLRVPNFTTD